MAKYDSLINDAKKSKGIPTNKPLNSVYTYHGAQRHAALKKCLKDPELFDNLV